MGLSGYYRKFIKNYSTIAKPLSELTKDKTPFKWTPECQEAFDTLKGKLCASPVLKYPDFSKEFTLTTDASNVGLGAILSQEGHPCYYISRNLNAPEKNYSTTEKELLAIVWAMRRLRQYLLGKKFKILTDHQALTWLFNVKDPSSRLMRWRLKLEEYEYEIEYKKGSENQAADALSRIFPIQEEVLPGTSGNVDFDLEAELPNIEIYSNPEERDLVTPEPDKQPPRIPTPIEIEPLAPLEAEYEERDTNEEKIQLNNEYYRWFSQPTETREVENPNANGKLWRPITKREPVSPNTISMGTYHETKWLNAINLIAKQTLERKLGILRLHFNDPTITSTERVKLRTIVGFISFKYPQLKIHTCHRSTTELSQEEKQTIIRESATCVKLKNLHVLKEKLKVSFQIPKRIPRIRLRWTFLVLFQ